MKLQTIRLSNFQSFGAAPTELSFEEITYLIGPNGAGKTASLQALCRLFAFDPSVRRVLRTDFHVPFDEEETPAEHQLWIEADFLFQELDEEEDNSTVPPHFGHMRLDEVDGIPRVRFRLSATMGTDGDIEESLVYVLDINADGSPLTTAQVPRSERNHIHVHYLPARRDPADHIAYGANALLGRMLRAVNWDAERTVIKGLTDQISDSLAANPSINAFSTSLKSAWSALHKGSFFADPKLTFVASEIDALLRHMSVSFTPGHDEQLVDFSRLSDGQKSMLYLSLVLSSQAIGRAVLAEDDDSFDVDKLGPPVFTVVAVEEPENSLSPHYLGRIVKQQRKEIAIAELVDEPFSGWWVFVRAFLKQVSMETLVSLSPDYESHHRLKEVVRDAKARIEELLRLEPDLPKALERFSDDQAVRILTIHKSKGLEFNSVIIMAVENEIFFGDQDENRCAYFVGISRAKKRLVLTHADQRERPSGHTRRWDVQRTVQTEYFGYATPFVRQEQ